MQRGDRSIISHATHAHLQPRSAYPREGEQQAEDVAALHEADLVRRTLGGHRAEKRQRLEAQLLGLVVLLVRERVGEVELGLVEGERREGYSAGECVNVREFHTTLCMENKTTSMIRSGTVASNFYEGYQKSGKQRLTRTHLQRNQGR